MFGINVNDGEAARARAGQPTLPLAALGNGQGCEAGRPVRLLDRLGQVVACGIVDTENDCVYLLAREEVHAFDAAFFRERVRRAARLRRLLGLVDGESAFRLLHGEGEGLPGFSVDVFGPYAVLCAPSRGLLAHARLLGEAVRYEVDGVRGVVLKVRGKDPRDRTNKDEVLGERPPEKLVVHELGVPYEVHLLGSLNVGLFLDMREQRRELSRLAAGRQVLNTFAYTGALSVTAARAGAASVTSVDLASGVLAWARANFQLAGLNAEDARFRFEVADVRRFMEREVERGAHYDLIIMDPPTVAVRASQWSLKRDYGPLVALATKLLPEEGGLLWVSANTRSGPSIMRVVDEGLRLAGRAGAVLDMAGLPPDFPTPAAWPEARYLEVCRVYVPGT